MSVAGVHPKRLLISQMLRLHHDGCNGHVECDADTIERIHLLAYNLGQRPCLCAVKQNWHISRGQILVAVIMLDYAIGLRRITSASLLPMATKV